MHLKGVIAKVWQISGFVCLMMWGSSAIADDPLGDCGEGFELVVDGSFEDILLPGNAQDPAGPTGGINEDEFICLWIQDASTDNGGQTFFIFVDNRKQGGGPPND